MAAARAGADTLLIVQRPQLGGIITYSWLNMLDMNYGKDKQLLTRGIFSEFYEAVGDTSFDIDEAQAVFDRMTRDEGKKLKVVFERIFSEPIIGWDRGTLVGIKVKNGDKVEKYFGKRLVDATQDADLAAAAGVRYTVGAEDIGWDRTMAATLIFKLAGVDWDVASRALNTDASAMTGSRGNSAWGFEKEIKGYLPSSNKFRLRGLNMGRQRDGTVMINALQIFGVNGLNDGSRNEAKIKAEKELERIIPYLRDNVPGFAEARLVAAAPELYVRETRHVIGEYRLDINDVMENRDFTDGIAIASYPVDIQAMSPDDWGNVVGNPVQYAIPIRCLVVKEVNNLLVAGRSASYTSLAAGSARVIPVGMVTGQAAGVTAAYAAKEGLIVATAAANALHVKRIRQRLVQQGAYLEPFEIKNPQRKHWAYDSVRGLRPMGLVMVGYENELSLEDTFTEAQFVRILFQALTIAIPEYTPKLEEIKALAGDELLAGPKMLELLTVVHRLPEYYREYDSKDLYRLMKDVGMLSYEFQRHYDPQKPLTRGQIYTLILDTIRYYKEGNG